MIEKIIVSEFVHRCGVIPKQNLWGGVFMCEQPTLKLVTGTDKRGFTYDNNAVCDGCIKEYFEDLAYDNGWNRAVEALCNRIEELDTDMFTPKQLSEYLYDVFFKQED